MRQSFRSVVSALALTLPTVVCAQNKPENSLLLPFPLVLQNDVTNQKLINELISYTSSLIPGMTEKEKILMADRICEKRLEIKLKDLVNNRKGKPTYRVKEKIQQLIDTANPANHPTHPLVPYTAIMSGHVTLKKGQCDVLQRITPVVSHALGLERKILIDQEFSNALKAFQDKKHLEVTGEINQQTVFELIKEGKIHSTDKGIFIGSTEVKAVEMRVPFNISGDEVIGTPTGSAYHSLTPAGKLLIEQIRTLLDVKEGSGYDGNLEVAIIKFRLKNIPKSGPNGRITTNLIRALQKNGLQIYYVNEDKNLYSTSLPNGLLLDKNEDLVKIASELFLLVHKNSREMEIALHQSGRYNQFLEKLEKIYLAENKTEDLEKVRACLQARKAGIDLPARVIYSDNGKLDKLKFFISNPRDASKTSTFIAAPIADYNGALQGTICKIQPLSNVVYSDIESVIELSQGIKEATFCGQTKISLFVSAGHGSSDGVTYGLDNNGMLSYQERTLTSSFDFSMHKDSFAEGAILFLDSCLTADDKECPKDSIAYKISRQLPNVFVIGYNLPVYGPKFWVVEGREELINTIEQLPQNARYVELPDNRYFIVSSTENEVPLVLNDSKLANHILKTHSRLSPERSPFLSLTSNFLDDNFFIRTLIEE